MCIGLFDADIFMYRAASAAEHIYYSVYPLSEPYERIGEEFASHKEMKAFVEKELRKKVTDFEVVKRKEVKPVFQAKMIIDQMINTVIKATGISESVFFLSDAKNFRHRLAVTKPYKDRTAEKPEHYQAMKDYLIGKYNAVILKDLEADDALAIWAEQCDKYNIPCVINSDDKDLRQIPTMHYNVRTGVLDHVHILPALRRFFKQVMTGDPTDSIPGLPGVGDKSPYVLSIDQSTEISAMTAIVRKAYIENKKLDVPDRMVYLNEQANLIYLRRHPNEGVSFDE